MRTAIEVLLLSRIAGHGLPPSKRRRLTAAILALGVVLVFPGRPAAAQTYTWDAQAVTPGALDESGTWSTSNSNWWNGTSDVSWPTSGGSSTAIFGTGGDTAGTVTVSGTDVAVGAMIFNPSAVGTYTIAGGSIALCGATPTITLNNNASIGSTLSGSGALSVIGDGPIADGVLGNASLEFTGANTYTGPTTVSGSLILRLSNSAALPTGSNLTLDDGVVELNAADFIRDVGTGPGQVQFTSNGGGFSAVGANRVVNLSNSATLTWGSTTGFLPSGGTLMLGSWSADSMIDFQNPLNLGGAPQTVVVIAGSGTAIVDARLSGTVSGSGALTIAGNGTLELTASNTYSGPTTVSGAILRLSNSGALPTTSNLTLDGGVVELNAGDFTNSAGHQPRPSPVYNQRWWLRGLLWQPHCQPRRHVGHLDMGHRRVPSQWCAIDARVGFVEFDGRFSKSDDFG